MKISIIDDEHIGTERLQEAIREVVPDAEIIVFADEKEANQFAGICNKRKRVRLQTFGKFELFIDENPVSFKYDKTKELLAYLVDRCGAYCTNKEIIAALWEDDNHESYLRTLKKDLLDTLKKYNCTEIIRVQWGKLGISVSDVECDYYEWKTGRNKGKNLYMGEYMAQYSWSETTNGVLFGDMIV